MAEKTTKKTVKKVESKSTNSMADLRALSNEDLQKRLSTIRADLLLAQKSLKADELANPRVVRKMRREIARILTVITANTVTQSEAKQSSDKKMDRHTDKSARDDKKEEK
jgi:ribosomal protein L29